MPSPNEIIQNLLNTSPSQTQSIDTTFKIDDAPSLNRIANNGKMLTQNISKLTETLKTVLQGWGT